MGGYGVSEVSAWLEGLGLGNYARAFEAHEIDFAALPHLTDSMLERIGLPLGPRARLLAAISELGPPPTPKPEPRPEARPQGRPRGERRQAERRQITVMFCDLVDSTRFSGALDPEDFGSMMQAYQKACVAIIDRYEGHVSQYRGDGIEAYFGWPAVYEDSAERAVRAGLEVVEAVKAIPGPEPLQARVGICTGMLMVSEAGLGDSSKPSGAVGEALHVASRLQALAAPSSVLIAEPTSRLVSGRFELDDLGVQDMKGVAPPAHAFRVGGVREDASRFQAARAATLTPLVGRRTELAFLQERWQDAKEGEGQTVCISGIAGIGKSRIIHEIKQRIRTEPHFTLSFQCLPHCTESPLFPIIQHIERLADFASGDSNRIKLEKLDRFIARATNHKDKALPLLAEMLSIPFEGRHAPHPLSAQQGKSQTLFVLVELLLGLAAQNPVLCVVEDAQWIDPSTQELLDLLAGQLERARILLIVTHRPEYRGIRGNASGLSVTRLGRRDLAEMARLALRDETVAPAVMTRIIEGSDSIPLFVEELARGAVESGAVSQATAGDQRLEPSPPLVPESLRDSLVARLDRAPGARSLAQIAAVIGREFSYDILRHVSSLSSAELDSTLAHLEQSEIVHLIDTKASLRYAFKHALVRDAAYESLLKSSRAEIHARVAAVLEKERPDIVAGQPELLGYHYGMARNADVAAQYWIAGGRRARSRSGNLEAISQFQKALEFLESLPDTPERVAKELESQLSLGLCFIAVQGYSAEDTRKSFERARSLSAGVGDSQKEIQATFGLWGHYWMRARHDSAIELGQTLLAKAEQCGDPLSLSVGHRVLGSTLFTQGDFVSARAHLEQALALGQRAAAEEASLSYAVDPRIASQLILAWDLWVLGFADQALHNAFQALALATERADPYSVAFAHYVTSAVQLLRGEFDNALAHADQSQTVSGEHRINLYALYSRFGRGCALAKMGQPQEAIAEIEEGIEQARRSNLGYMQGFMLGWLAIVQAETGDPETALATIKGALRQVNDVSGHAWEAELRRLQGEVLLMARPDAADATERSYNDAIAVAQKQHARSLELRATTSLARLLRSQGRNEEARRRLAPILDWFSEGFDTADLAEAKKLLATLG
jgi:class 3 adenylate cyclase/tetratricopeptide (TPR) repeat protein